MAPNGLGWRHRQEPYIAPQAIRYWPVNGCLNGLFQWSRVMWRLPLCSCQMPERRHTVNMAKCRPDTSYTECSFKDWHMSHRAHIGHWLMASVSPINRYWSSYLPHYPLQRENWVQLYWELQQNPNNKDIYKITTKTCKHPYTDYCSLCYARLFKCLTEKTIYVYDIVCNIC